MSANSKLYSGLCPLTPSVCISSSHICSIPWSINSSIYCVSSVRITQCPTYFSHLNLTLYKHFLKILRDVLFAKLRSLSGFLKVQLIWLTFTFSQLQLATLSQREAGLFCRVAQRSTHKPITSLLLPHANCSVCVIHLEDHSLELPGLLVTDLKFRVRITWHYCRVPFYQRMSTDSRNW